jgi:hypothetical protein
MQHNNFIFSAFLIKLLFLKNVYEYAQDNTIPNFQIFFKSGIFHYNKILDCNYSSSAEKQYKYTFSKLQFQFVKMIRNALWLEWRRQDGKYNK